MKKSAQPLVTVAVLNWNGLDDTMRCLESLRELVYPNLEIIIVDNGSSDGSKEFLAKQKDILFLDLPTNRGFTGGHLAAYEAAKGEYHVIFNNDLVVDSEWIEKALETFSRHKSAAVVGGKLYKWDKNNPLFNRDNEYYAYQEVNQADANTYTLLVGEHECPVDSISGAALMFKRAVLDKVGYFDDDFFAYYEETDLIARLKRAGYTAYYNPVALAWHKIAASSEGGEAGSFYLYMMHRNRYLYASKNFDDVPLKQFRRNYHAEVIKQLMIYLRRRSLESKMRLKAYIWNIYHKRQTLEKRQQVLKLGSSYNSEISTYQPVDVTVVIPCYNYAEYVSEAINSVLGQTLKPEKIIIINDGSTDDSRQRIDKYKNEPSVEIIHQKNSGVIKTKNLGVALSKTYWTVFLDADDVINPEYLQKLVDLGNHQHADVVYTDMEYFGAIKDIFRSRPFNIFPMTQRNYIHNSALIKTSRLKQVGGYKQQMKDGLEDWELYLSLYELGAKFAYLPEAIFKYRQHAGALSRNIDVQKNKEPQLYQQLINMHPRIFKHMSLRRRRVIRALDLLTKFISHPYLVVVVIKSLPRAAVNGAHTTLHEIRTYLDQKENN